MDSQTTSNTLISPAPKTPKPGELWLDEKAWAVTGKPRLLLVNGLHDETVDATAIRGGDPGPQGVPLHYFDEVMTWQGYWSKTPAKLPHLAYPYTGNLLANVRSARFAGKLNGRVDLMNSLVPSLSPHGIEGFDGAGMKVPNVYANRPVSSIPKAARFLRFTYTGRAKFGGDINAPDGLSELWYQRQGNVWWLVRSLIAELPPEPDSSVRRRW